ncbi:MAG: amino acid permease [Candidatus Thermoplasmatota archaeon]|nr:amino acid permease [Candidatus Thermoplasmatota archaeon]
MGLPGALAVGVGGTIGGGIFVLVGKAAFGAGPAVILSFIIAFFAALLIAIPYAELACRFPLAGGAYAFTSQVLGRRWAMVAGWNYWGAYIFVSGYVTLGFGGYLDLLTGIPETYGSLLLVAVITTVNLAGIRSSGKVQVLLVILAMGSLLSFAALGIPHIHARNFSPFFPHGIGGVSSAALIAFLAFGGFDMIASAGEEVKNPERNLPAAIILTLLIVLIAYLAVTVVAVGTLPLSYLGNSTAPLSEVAVTFLGTSGSRLIALAAIITTAATASAVLIATSRISFAMARDGLFPGFMSRVDGRRGTPYAAVLVNGVLLGAIVLTGSIELAVAVGGFLFTLHFIFPLASLTKLKLESRNGNPGQVSPFTMPLPKIVMPAAFFLSFLLIYSSGLTGIALGSAWMGAGLILGMRQKDSRNGMAAI